VNKGKKKGQSISATDNILNERCARAALAVLLGRLLDRRGRFAQLLRDHHGMDLLRPSLVGASISFSLHSQTNGKPTISSVLGVAGCATGSARISEAPIYMEEGFKAATYWVILVYPVPLNEYPKDAKWLQ